MKIFSDLGLSIDDRWRDANYSEPAFPEIAAGALAEANLLETVTPWDIVRWLGSESQLPKQQDPEGHFGNPPITLYSAARFYIDIYFWVDGTTQIHEHSFAGAFQVLTGSSIHSRYSFRKDVEINQHFHIGQMNLEAVELLQGGDIRQIIPGSNHIHALFHLDRPSATITVRTFGLLNHQPQYSYHRPYLAIDPFYKEPSLARKLQTVTMLLSLQGADHDDLIRDFIAGSDLQTAFLILRTAFLHLRENQLEKIFHLSSGRDRFEKMVEVARTRHGDRLDYLVPVMEEQGRVLDIVHRRAFITAPEHRFFLALILNVPSRDKLLDSVGRRHPEQDPIELVLDWVMELSTTKVWASNEPNVLGIAGFNDDYLFVLECLLRDYSPAQVQTVIEGLYPADHAEKLKVDFETIAGKLRESILFRALFAQ